MADEEPQNVGKVSADAVHREGTEHIKQKVAENEQQEKGSTEGTSTTPAITPAKPPASNPGSDDATAGIAKDAGGVSGAAYVESPVTATATSAKRKSIVGTLKDFLGFDMRGYKKVSSSQQPGVVASTTAAASAATTQLVDRTKTATAGEQGNEADKGAASADSTAEKKDDTDAEAPEPSSDSKNENLPDSETSGENEHKPPKSSGNPKAMENREAIPTAGGEKLGDKHWGESKMVPDNPKPEGEGVSSAEGQPTSEVKDNTAKNTGGATGGPNSKGEGEKKEKFFDKVKDKFSKKKE